MPLCADAHGSAATFLRARRYASEVLAVADVSVRLSVTSRSSLGVCSASRRSICDCVETWCDARQRGLVAEWLSCWTQAQKGPRSNRSRDAARVTAGVAEINGSLPSGL